jgi:hypothetical protein
MPKMVESPVLRRRYKNWCSKEAALPSGRLAIVISQASS